MRRDGEGLAVRGFGFVEAAELEEQLGEVAAERDVVRRDPQGFAEGGDESSEGIMGECSPPRKAIRAGVVPRPSLAGGEECATSVTTFAQTGRPAGTSFTAVPQASTSVTPSAKSLAS